MMFRNRKKPKLDSLNFYAKTYHGSYDQLCEDESYTIEAIQKKNIGDSRKTH